MSTPVAKLSTIQKQNISIIVARCIVRGITSHVAQAAILSIVGKECDYIPVNENLNYTAAGLLKVFPSRVKTLAQAKALEHKPELIANTIYGGRYGNAANEGYKFRGRGFNQITFKDTYKKIGAAIGVDLISNPDALNNPSVAADAMIEYFKGRIKTYYPKVDINKVSSLTDSLNIFYNSNAGAVNKHLSDTTGGYVKAKNSVEELFTLVSNNKAATGGGLFFLMAIGLAIYKRKQIAAFVTAFTNKHKTK